MNKVTKTKNKKAFTLVEMIMTLLIFGIIAVFSVPLLKARNSETLDATPQEYQALCEGDCETYGEEFQEGAYYIAVSDPEYFGSAGTNIRNYSRFFNNISHGEIVAPAYYVDAHNLVMSIGYYTVFINNEAYSYNRANRQERKKGCAGFITTNKISNSRIIKMKTYAERIHNRARENAYINYKKRYGANVNAIFYSKR